MGSNSRSGVKRDPLLRYNPYPLALRASSKKKQEAVRLGVKLSVCLAESMFLLCDDIHTMLCFCFKLWRVAEKHRYNNNDFPVVEKLLGAMHYVYSKDIKPKKRVFQSGSAKSVQWELVSMDFDEGIIHLHNLFFSLTKPSTLDGLLLALFKQLLMKLEAKLRSAHDVSKANGFSRKTIESSFLHLWNEEATPPIVMNNRIIVIITDLFHPFLDGRFTLAHSISELKEEVVRLGVELSVYVAQSMFFLCDYTHSMRLFCFRLWRDAIRNRNRHSPVAQRLLLVIHYVYSKYIKPNNNGVSQNSDRLARWSLIMNAWEDFSYVIQGLDDLVSTLRGEGNYFNGPVFIQEALKKIEENLWRAKPVSEFNGFAREAMESNILDLWKSVFDKEAKEATQTLKVINNRILTNLFLPIWNQLPPP